MVNLSTEQLEKYLHLLRPGAGQGATWKEYGSGFFRNNDELKQTGQANFFITQDAPVLPKRSCSSSPWGIMKNP